MTAWTAEERSRKERGCGKGRSWGWKEGGKREKEEGEEGGRDVGESRSRESCGERGLEESEKSR